MFPKFWLLHRRAFRKMYLIILHFASIKAFNRLCCVATEGNNDSK